MAAVSSRECEISGCPKLAAKGARYCSMHRQRLLRGKPLHAPPQERLSPLGRLLEAALRYAEAEDDADYDRAVEGVKAAARRFVREEEAS
jgi:hypothetical protein